MATQSELAQHYADSGFDVFERGDDLIVDVPNPDTTSDSYFHGANPHTEGFGSRGPDAERIHQGDARAHGDSTAAAQEAAGGLGWGEHAGAPDAAEGVQRAAAAAGDRPDTGTRNDDIRAYAQRNGIDLGGATVKAEMLAVIDAHHADLADAAAAADENEGEDENDPGD